MRKITLKQMIVGAAAVTLLTATPVDAAREGPSGTITIAQDDGVVALAATPFGDPVPTYEYEQTVAFDTELLGNVSKKARTYITVSCMKDGHAVYRWSADTDFEFPLADQPAYEWDGGDALCTAYLMYQVKQGKSYSYQTLDWTNFQVVAGLA